MSTHTDFESLWRHARSLENDGDLTGALAVYTAILQDNPDRLYVRLRASALEEAFGNYRRSHEHAMATVELVRRGRWNDIGAVTRRLLNLDEHAALAELILEADWSRPEVLSNSAMSAQHLYVIGRVEEALALIETVWPRAAHDPLLAYTKGTALRYLGRMSEATEEYERCLRIEPSFPSAHWALAYHQKAEPPLSRIDRIRKAQAAMDDAHARQAYLHYALFKEYDNAGEVALAWQSLARGAQIKRASISYDADEAREGFQALLQTQKADFQTDAARDAPPQGRVPIFIVGMPRTGTTLLERILGNHSQVASGGELRDFNSALRWEADSFIPSSPAPSLPEKLRRVDFAKVGARYLQRTSALSEGFRYLIDKNPMNFAYAGYIAKALPQAKIVCLRRSPMDACFSNLKELFSNNVYGYSYGLGELAEHYAQFARLLEHWQAMLPDNFLAVAYEDLVADASGSANRIMRFCGLDFETDTVDITKNDSPVATASSSQVRQPIHNRNVGAWRPYADYLEPLRARLTELLPSGAYSD